MITETISRPSASANARRWARGNIAHDQAIEFAQLIIEGTQETRAKAVQIFDVFMSYLDNLETAR